HTVNTVPPATYAAFLDHGTVAATLSRDLDTARAELAALPDLGIDLDSITDRLETQGLQAFEQAYEHLLQGIAGKRRDLAGNGGAKG
ncbi:MAG TPA: transaldolase family protein, partial [Thioalkalivibrio sp.]|nr:transaldolase family protein [Thioalkalivibrio sp.]